MSDTQGAAKAAPNKQNTGQEISYIGARLREKSTYGGLAVAVGLALPFLSKLDPHLAGTSVDTLVTAISYLGMGVGIFIGVFLPENGSKAVIAFFAAMVALSFALPAHAQNRFAAVRAAPVASSSGTPQFQFPQLPCDPLKLIAFCKSESGTTEGPTAQTADGFSNLLQEIYDKIHSQGQAVIADMQKAQSIAEQKFSDGTEADAPSDKCLAAVIPVAQLIVDNQLVPSGVTPAASGTPPPATGTATPAPAAAPATPDGPITIFVKTRVIVNALQNPSVQSGCAWLQSSINQAGTSGLANVLAGLVGLTKLGVSIPGVAL
jgi:hypothetical protein